MSDISDAVMSLDSCVDCLEVMNIATEATVLSVYSGNYSLWYNVTPPDRPGMEDHARSSATLVLLSLLFFVIGITGICGNALVVFAVILNRKMRTSMTNLLITNLAMADLVIMILGVPETIQFMMDNGWTLQEVYCKVNRYILVTALYGSVLTLMALCVER